MKLTKLLLITFSICFLAACSDGPSESDIESVMQKNFDDFNELVPAGLGTNMKFEIHEIISHGCEKKPDNIYVCDIEVDMSAPMIGRRKDRSKVDFIKKDGNWQTTAQFKP